MIAPIVIIGGGPAGLFVATQLHGCGHPIHVYDCKPTLGRKFLMAGRGGLNLTHSEDVTDFIGRYGDASSWMKTHIDRFTPHDLRAWADALGQETFTGSSGRVFPKAMKASPLLRAWQQQLSDQGVTFHLNHQWCGWDENRALVFQSGEDTHTIDPAATIVAMGGASWPKLGSDGGWAKILSSENIPLIPFSPANCGLTVSWSDHFRTRFAGKPLKTIGVHFGKQIVSGDIMISENGVEGGAIYAISSAIRSAIPTKITIDLRPGLSHAALAQKLSAPRRGQTLSNHLRRTIGLDPVATAFMYEGFGREGMATAEDSGQLAKMVKATPLTITGTAGLDRAISSAGGIDLSAVDENLMIRSHPGVFAAGEMLDWEAPTGGYLLQGCFSTAFTAAQGVKTWLKRS